MKAELRLSDHSQLPGEKVIEIWYGGRMIGTVTGADGPGVRILSKYPIIAVEIPNERPTPVHVVEVRVFE